MIGVVGGLVVYVPRGEVVICYSLRMSGARLPALTQWDSTLEGFAVIVDIGVGVLVLENCKRVVVER